MPIVTFCSNTVPGKPPINITAKAISPTSIEVRWNYTSFHLKCPTTAVEILYSLSNRTVFPTGHEDSLLVNWIFNHARLEELSKFQNYSLWVRSKTVLGYGMISKPVFVQTLEDGKSSSLFENSFKVSD